MVIFISVLVLHYFSTSSNKWKWEIIILTKSLKISVLPQESLSQLSPSFEWKHSFIRDPDMKDSSNHVSVRAEGSDGSLVHIRWLGFICLLWVMLFQVRVLHWISSIYAARVGLTVLDSEWWDSLDCLVMIVLSTGRLLS